MRALHIFAFGFLLASGLFVATMLVTPPTSEASIAPARASTVAATICDVLPTGDIANCTVQN